jgi:hypothetical protein
MCLRTCPTYHSTSFFEFNIPLVPADFNRDNLVDGSDFNIWNDNKFTGPHPINSFVIGDGSGDDFVDGSDFGVWNGTKFTCWESVTDFLADGECSGSQSMAVGGGGMSLPSASWVDEFDELMERHRILLDGSINQTLSQTDWELFVDELMILFDQL